MMTSSPGGKSQCQPTILPSRRSETGPATRTFMPTVKRSLLTPALFRAIAEGSSITQSRVAPDSSTLRTRNWTGEKKARNRRSADRKTHAPPEVLQAER